MAKAKLETTSDDSAGYLETPETIAAYLAAAFEENDPAIIAHALGVVARSKGMSAIAKTTNLSRESLYRALSAEGNPQLSTIIKVLNEIGLSLSVKDFERSHVTGAAKARYELYRDPEMKWHWHLVAGDGRVIAVSGAAYANRRDCLEALGLMRNAPAFPIEEPD